jgi:hypothetical protein
MRYVSLVRAFTTVAYYVATKNWSLAFAIITTRWPEQSADHVILGDDLVDAISHATLKWAFDEIESNNA